MAQGQANKGSGTTALMIIAVALVAFVGGYFIGTKSGGTDGEAPVVAEAEEGAAAVPTGKVGDSDKIPVGDSYILGNPNAPVTVVEFSDFQCPFCQRGGDTVKQLQEKYPNDVRVVFKHYPLPFHQEADEASQAALAAGEQGKFWEMHDLLFQNFKNFKGKDMKEFTSGLAKQLGLDVAKFQKDYDKPEFKQIIEADQKLGQSIGVRGTPHFFINGERLSGAQPLAKFEEITKKQLEEAKKALAAGTKKDELYAKMVAKNFADAPTPEKREAPAQVVEYVEVRDNDPIKGAKDDYLVTIVEFSDFQCPFCSRVNPTIDQILKNYGDKVRIVFKQNPLPFHQEADEAAKAALAAHQQGKFWEMHDLLFQNFKNFKGADMKELTSGYAKQLGLNVAKFEKDYADPKLDEWVKEDLALGRKVGARGTPNFFVNGVQVVGAKPYPAFETEIKGQIEKAEALKKKGLKGDALYKALVEQNKKDAPAAPAPAAQPDKPADKVDTAKLKVGDSYVKGPKNAPVTIVEYSDFQCPYCSRGNQTVQDMVKEYDGKVNVVFKAFPLPFHKEAEPAHRAAIAAGKQGKFWEYHDKLFANQQALKDLSNLEKYAKELGLNVDKWKKDMESEAVKKQVQEEMAQGREVGVRGTPAFFINGNRLVGAQPADRFKAIIDAELKK